MCREISGTWRQINDFNRINTNVSDGSVHRCRTTKRLPVRVRVSDHHQFTADVSILNCRTQLLEGKFIGQDSVTFHFVNGAAQPRIIQLSICSVRVGTNQVEIDSLVTGEFGFDDNELAVLSLGDVVDADALVAFLLNPSSGPNTR